MLKDLNAKSINCRIMKEKGAAGDSGSTGMGSIDSCWVQWGPYTPDLTTSAVTGELVATETPRQAGQRTVARNIHGLTRDARK
jgi:hypothetical protein